MLKRRGEGANTSNSATTKTAKKKIVKRIVKKQVSEKKVAVEIGTAVKLDKKAIEIAETAVQQDASTATPKSVKTVTKKKVGKKAVEAAPAENVVDKDCSLKNDKQSDSTEVKSSVTEAKVGPVKKMVKRKIIRKVPKKKVTGGAANTETGDGKSIQSADGKMANAGNVGQKVVDADLNAKASEGNNQPISDARAQPSDKVITKEEKKADEKRVSKVEEDEEMIEEDEEEMEEEEPEEDPEEDESSETEGSSTEMHKRNGLILQLHVLPYQ